AHAAPPGARARRAGSDLAVESNSGGRRRTGRRSCGISTAAARGGVVVGNPERIHDPVCLNDPLVLAVEDQLHPAAQLELLVDAMQMGLHRPLGDIELLSDALAPQARGRPAHDLDLAGGEELADLAGSR